MTHPFASTARRITDGRQGGAVGAARSVYRRFSTSRASAGEQPEPREAPEPAADDAEVARLRAELSAELDRLAERSS